jgi:MFS superfamily sulfate permease-like transporter
VDLIPGVVTFGACLAARLELGIVAGIAVNLAFLLYASARPAVRVSHAFVSIPSYASQTTVYAFSFEILYLPINIINSIMRYFAEIHN